MSDIEIYKLAGWLGDTETIFNLFEKDITPELDFHMFLEDLSWSYFSNEFLGFQNDLHDHLTDILGQELSFVSRCLN